MTTADLLIIGAGSAGCVLAERLSRDPSRRVLVVEAGPTNDHLFIRMPAAVAKAIGSPRFNWQYQTAPLRHLGGRGLSTPRGRVLGGSSSINALVYIRGNAWDYDNWAALGCPGWDYESVLPYFRAVEANALGAGPYHGDAGPLTVSHPESESPAFEAFIAAGETLGHPRNPDFNGSAQAGFGPFQLNIRDGRRWSAADAFLLPAAQRPNLTLRTDARAIGLTASGSRITGAALAGRGGVEAVTAGDVVLAAGAIGSPHLMLLSGIGPGDHLRAYGIGIVADAPGVGAGLHDHLEVKVKHRMTRPWSMWSHARFPNWLWTGARYLATGQGAGRQQGLEAGAFLSLDPSAPAPDTQLHFINALSFDGGTAADRGHGYAIDVTHTRPESRGTLTLTSTDPGIPPRIDPNYLSEDTERRMMRDGLKLLRALCRQPALAKISGPELQPGPEVQTDDALDAYIRRTAESIYHPVGTARMGVDAAAVVDPATMAVKGVDNLYLADASVMPQLVSGNTHAASVMIGTKGADLIAAAIG